MRAVLVGIMRCGDMFYYEELVKEGITNWKTFRIHVIRDLKQRKFVPTTTSELLQES